MKKNIIKLLLFSVYFLFLFVIINVLYTLVIVSDSSGYQKRKEILSFKDADFKLIALGASTTLDGIDAELLTNNGINSYNMAINGASVKTNYIMLKEYINNCMIPPKYVILGINSGMVKTFDDETIHPIIEVTMKDHKYDLSDIPILKFKWLGFEYIKKYFILKKGSNVVLGQLRVDKTVPDITEYTNSELKIDKIRSSFWVSEIAKICGQNGIKLFVFEMPGIKSTQNDSATGPFHLRFKNGYSAELFNFGSRKFCAIFDSQNDWLGNSHLNKFGAKKFTNKVVDIINEYEN